MKAFGFLVALIVAAFVTTEASAAAIQYSFNLGTVSTGSVLAADTEDHPAGNQLTAFDYYASGNLAAHTAITFTFAANNVLDSFYQFETGTYNGFNTSLTLASPDSTATESLVLSPSLVPVLLSASFTLSEEGSMFGDLAGTITIKNLTNSIQDFGARFTSFITQIGCEPTNFITVTTAVSSVPLPAAALLFGSGLMGLAGFGSFKRRKA